MNIKSVTIQNHDTGYGGYPIKYVVMVEMPAKDYTKLKGDLGSLVLHVNNEVYKTYKVPAWNPSIDSKGSKRAVKGIKTLEFVYFSKDLELAKALGMPMHTFKSGELMPKFGEYVQLKKVA